MKFEKNLNIMLKTISKEKKKNFVKISSFFTRSIFISIFLTLLKRRKLKLMKVFFFPSSFKKKEKIYIMKSCDEIHQVQTMMKKVKPSTKTFLVIEVWRKNEISAELTSNLKFFWNKDEQDEAKWDGTQC